MSDFFLDLRPREARELNGVSRRLSFSTDTTVVVADEPGFGLVVAHAGKPELWSPWCAPDGSLVAVAGYPAFDAGEWEAARHVEGCGGLAAAVVCRAYGESGASALERLNGNCVAIVYDARRRCLHVATDRCGVLPAFRIDLPGTPIYCSHPDVLAEATGEGHRLDELSLAEFILTGTVTPPFTYYERIRALGHGMLFTIDVDRPRSGAVGRHYFRFSYRGSDGAREEDLVAELADTIRTAVRRRSRPLLGRPAVALSGGLDSRTIVASSAANRTTFAFSCYGEPNRELRTAEAVSATLNVPFLPLRRGFDYYAENAERGVLVSGGMGNFANNHFLGFIPRLKSEGMDILLTGCYCDYLFKGLAINRRVSRLTHREKLAPFRHEFYFEHARPATPLAERARERWEARVPGAARAQTTPAAVFDVEAARTFPLCYEGDNQQRTVAQRMTVWCPPFVDRDLTDLYCRIPYHFKLNRSLFRKTVALLVPGLRRVIDANTGARLDSSAGLGWLLRSQTILSRKLRRLSQSAVSEESWPNWYYYVRRSPTIDALWRRPNTDAADFFRRVLGPAGVPREAGALSHGQVPTFLALLTAKLWLDQRRCSNG